MTRCKLTVREEARQPGERAGVVVPRLAKVAYTPAVDRLLVHVPIGSTRDAFDRAADHIANAAGSEQVRVRDAGPARSE